ncbi:Rgp1-domain-containing protein [Laetiporus sulphureus 93-53]|uniref:Rgp1-domain-containing protein n=1 Tax=Laetiporus sulphureus 93-53 TaxID=1314785 RepID=A0A165FJQ4_9APHY|nr:Rgp1-domain-containing protein [Laetiporus sulphureus 93-53]KZT09076.1 Rgp1-domain-containing protein [Laetiporus sulphureus 93-53]
MLEGTSVDDAIRVVAAPSQASYFAGEPFTVTITFTNTRSPDALHPRSASHSVSHAHKRSAHSISSVPLARPPTSPGMTRSALSTMPTSLPPRHSGPNRVPTRKGLIGRNRSANGVNGTDGPPTEPAVRKPMSKSLSISVTSYDLDPKPQEPAKGKSPLSQVRNGESLYPTPTSPHISSPLTRSVSFPVSPDHPHARKQSISVGQAQIQDVRSPYPPTPSASTSNHSLTLDTISESSLSLVMPPLTPAIPSPIPETAPSNIRTQMPSIPTGINGKTNGTVGPRAPARRPPQLGHGPPPIPGGSQQPRSALSASFPVPNTELILYSYAQLVGTLSLVPPPGTVGTPEQTRMLNHVRSSLLKRQVMGGGSMDITPSLNSQPFSQSSSAHLGRHSRSRSVSVTSSLFSMLSPSAASATQSFAPSHRARAPSVFSLFSTQTSTVATSGVGLGFTGSEGGGEDEDEVDPETPLPTFEVQPAMLAVDLSLAPGESRSYTYTLVLPENLPPTYKGRALRFSYQFILGVCRASSSGGRRPSAGGLGANSSSRVMKVPIRVYNHVTVGRPPCPYDLLWPVSFWKMRGMQCSPKVIEELKHPAKKQRQAPAISPEGKVNPESFEDLQSYAKNLLASIKDGGGRPHWNGKLPMPIPIETVDLEQDRDREEAGGLSGCRQAVDLLTRNPRKASYDVNKDGVKVAVLTFTKSAYRLGETVLGVVELNERASRAKVLKLSAMLEAHESLPSALSSLSPAAARQLRRVHAEHHNSFMPATLRTTFALDIPPDATPAFQVDVSAGPDHRPGGLEWKVRLCLLVAVAQPTSKEGPGGLRLRHLVRDGPGGEWGSSWKAAWTIAPMERPDLHAEAEAANAPGQMPSASGSWLSYFTAPLLGPATGYHDGDEVDEEKEGDDTVGEEGEWREVRTEVVECEVPIRVWPGNTAFKATEVIFDV